MAASIRGLGLHFRLSESSVSDVPSSAIFRDICKLTGLRRLELLDYGLIGVTPNKDILSLGRLTQLRQLTVYDFRVPYFTDGDFEQVIAKLHNLRVIVFMLKESRLTTSTLGIIAKHCPSLLWIQLTGDFDMIMLKQMKVPSLSRLEDLSIGRFINTESGVSHPPAPLAQIKVHGRYGSIISQKLQEGLWSSLTVCIDV
ncbi:hypothetical protein APSETT444_005479 [Aspergillus pseudonomiae]